MTGLDLMPFLVNALRTPFDGIQPKRNHNRAHQCCVPSFRLFLHCLVPLFGSVRHLPFSFPVFTVRPRATRTRIVTLLSYTHVIVTSRSSGNGVGDGPQVLSRASIRPSHPPPNNPNQRRCPTPHAVGVKITFTRCRPLDSILFPPFQPEP